MPEEERTVKQLFGGYSLGDALYTDDAIKCFQASVGELVLDEIPEIKQATDLTEEQMDALYDKALARTVEKIKAIGSHEDKEGTRKQFDSMGPEFKRKQFDLALLKAIMEKGEEATIAGNEPT